MKQIACKTKRQATVAHLYCLPHFLQARKDSQELVLRDCSTAVAVQLCKNDLEAVLPEHTLRWQAATSHLVQRQCACDELVDVDGPVTIKVQLLHDLQLGVSVNA